MRNSLKEVGWSDFLNKTRSTQTPTLVMSKKKNEWDNWSGEEYCVRDERVTKIIPRYEVMAWSRLREKKFISLRSVSQFNSIWRILSLR